MTKRARPVTAVARGVGALVIALFLVLGLPAGAGAAFTVASSPAAGADPTAIAAGDFNEDGKPDLAVADDVAAGAVTLLTGNGDGTFTGGGSVSTAQYPGSVVVGDWNGDGHQDLAASNSEVFTGGAAGSVSVFLGDGHGGFTAVAAPAVNHPRAITTGDFNGDGNEDLATTNTDAHTVSLLIGAGNGAFTHSATEPGTAANDIPIVSGDFNNDGHDDLATGDSSNPGSLTVLAGVGDGTFTHPHTDQGAGAFPTDVAVGDFNGDVNQDTAASNYSVPGAVTVLTGAGNGTFTHVTPNPAVGDRPQSIAAGDFNGDGYQDLVTADSTAGTLSLLVGAGDGTFTAAGSSTAGSSPRALAVGDFNGDGNQDVAVADSLSAGKVTVLVSTDPPVSGNLLADGGADASGAAGTPSASPVPPGWTRDQGAFTYVRYGSAGGFPRLLLAPTIRGGTAFFSGGPGSPVSSASQTVNVASSASSVDAGLASVRLSGLLGGFSTDADNVVVSATFLDTGGAAMGGQVQIGPVTAADRKNTTALLPRAATAAVPPGTRSIAVRIVVTRVNGGYDDGYADNIALTLNAPAPGAPPGGGGGTPPGGGGGTPPGGGGGPGAATAPVLGSLKLSPLKFRAAKGGASAAAKRKPRPVGSHVSFTLDQAATTTFLVTRSARGVRKGKRCVAAPRKKSGKTAAKRCTRTIGLGTFTRASTAGANGFRFTGRLRNRALKPGTYTLHATARNATGKVGLPRTKRFAIVL